MAAFSPWLLVFLLPLLGKKRRRRVVSEVDPDVAAAAEIGWEEDGSYLIGDAWWGEVATPKLQELDRLLGGIGPVNDDPYTLAWTILHEETGPYALPATPYPPAPPPGQPPELSWGDEWQTDIPGRGDFYEGPETVLFLIQHLADHIEYALQMYSEGYPLVLLGSTMGEDACPEGYVWADSLGKCIPDDPSKPIVEHECPPGMRYNVRLDMCVPASGNGQEPEPAQDDYAAEGAILSTGEVVNQAGETWTYVINSGDHPDEGYFWAAQRPEDAEPTGGSAPSFFGALVSTSDAIKADVADAFVQGEYGTATWSVIGYLDAAGGLAFGWVAVAQGTGQLGAENFGFGSESEALADLALYFNIPADTLLASVTMGGENL